MIWSGRVLLGRNRAAAIGCCCLCAQLQVSSNSLAPDVSGVLTLFSARYPSPGFTGTYDCE